MPGNLPSERRRSGSSTPGHVRPEGTAPRKSEVTSAETAPARTQQHTGRGGSGGAVLASVPGRHGRLGGTTTGTNRDSRRGTGNGGNGVCTGFQGWSLLGGEAARACCRGCRAA